MSYNRTFEEYDYQTIQEKKKTATQPLPPSMVSKAIHKEAKTGTFAYAEELFQLLTQIFKYKTTNKPGYYFSDLDVIAMQRALSSLIRYAPNTERARYYFCYALRELEKPLRTESFEITILNNILFVYTSKNDEQHMKDALTLIECALDIDVFHVQIPTSFSQQNARFDNPLDVFETLCKKVLRYYRLEFNDDKTATRPQQRMFSHN